MRLHATDGGQRLAHVVAAYEVQSDLYALPSSHNTPYLQKKLDPLYTCCWPVGTDERPTAFIQQFD